MADPETGRSIEDLYDLMREHKGSIEDIDNLAEAVLERQEDLEENIDNLEDERDEYRNIVNEFSTTLENYVGGTTTDIRDVEDDLLEIYNKLEEIDPETSKPAGRLPVYGYGVFNFAWDAGSYLNRKRKGKPPKYIDRNGDPSMTPKMVDSNKRKFIGTARDTLLIGATGFAYSNQRESQDTNDRLDNIEQGLNEHREETEPGTARDEESYINMLSDDEFESVYGELSTNDRSRINMDEDNWEIFQDDLNYVKVEVNPGSPSEDSGIKYVLDDREDLGWIRFDDQLAEDIAERGEPYE